MELSDILDKMNSMTDGRWEKKIEKKRVRPPIRQTASFDESLEREKKRARYDITEKLKQRKAAEKPNPNPNPPTKTVQQKQIVPTKFRPINKYGLSCQSLDCSIEKIINDDSDSDSDVPKSAKGIDPDPYVNTFNISVLAVQNMKKCLNVPNTVVAVDLEWSGEGREAKICLLQAAIPGDRVYLFDFIEMSATDIWRSGLKDILESKTILKIFHDCRHDSDVLHRSGVNLTNVFDTQIAYSIHRRQQGLGTPLPVSLNTLLKRYTSGVGGGENKFKEEARKQMETIKDYWSQRPLTEIQKAYAREDVLHLPLVYSQLKATLNINNQKLVLRYSEDYTNQYRKLDDEAFAAKTVFDGIPKYNIDTWDSSAFRSLEKFKLNSNRNFRQP